MQNQQMYVIKLKNQIENTTVSELPGCGDHEFSICISQTFCNIMTWRLFIFGMF